MGASGDPLDEDLASIKEGPHHSQATPPLLVGDAQFPSRSLDPLLIDPRIRDSMSSCYPAIPISNTQAQEAAISSIGGLENSPGGSQPWSQPADDTVSFPRDLERASLSHSLEKAASINAELQPLSAASPIAEGDSHHDIGSTLPSGIPSQTSRSPSKDAGGLSPPTTVPLYNERPLGYQGETSSGGEVVRLDGNLASMEEDLHQDPQYPQPTPPLFIGDAFSSGQNLEEERPQSPSEPPVDPQREIGRPSDDESSTESSHCSVEQDLANERPGPRGKKNLQFT